jgi:hypothetical protein
MTYRYDVEICDIWGESEQEIRESIKEALRNEGFEVASVSLEGVIE